MQYGRKIKVKCFECGNVSTLCANNLGSYTVVDGLECNCSNLRLVVLEELK